MKTKLTFLLLALLALTLAPAGAAVRYVNLANPSPAPPYTSWVSAATNIQDAIDAADAGDEVLVTNGVYATGGRAVVGTMTNRVAVTKAVTVRSVNGPDVTIIDGGGSSRCVYLGSGATLMGFTLTNGAADQGGGVACESDSAVVSNCTLTGNSAISGGGASYGTLNHCTLTGNSAFLRGGGAFLGTLNNCTLTGNSADVGGGASGLLFELPLGKVPFHVKLNNCTITGNSARSGSGADYATANNCIVYFNTNRQFSEFGDNNYNHGTLNYSCTTPLPGGMGNFDGPPQFIDPEHGDYRLQPASPCINAGNNSFAPAGTDLDGMSRIVGGTVDVGAYELQSPQSVISYAWLLQFGLPIDATTDTADPDGDRFNNWQEWRAGTDPTNALSALRLLTPVANDWFSLVTWESVPGRTYTLERSEALGDFQFFVSVATGIPATPDGNLTDYYDFVEDPWPASRCYRVRVEQVAAP